MSKTIISRISLLAGLWVTQVIPALATNSATVVAEINTASTVRVHSLGGLEPLMNIVVNGYELGGLVAATAVLTTVPRIWRTTGKLPKKRLIIGSLLVASALGSSSLFNLALHTLAASALGASSLINLALHTLAANN